MLIYLIPMLFLILGCQIDRPIENKEEATPEILNTDKKRDYEISFSRGRYSNIVEKLYKEALENDEKLESINSAILAINEQTSEEIKEYKSYSKINKEYWESTQNYINRLKDSTLKDGTMALFEQFELNYQKKIAIHESKMATIKSKTRELQDQLVLMKLFVSKEMIENYQKNELPEISSLENLIKKQQDLIEQTKAFTKTTN